MDRARATAIVRTFANKKVVVLGDLMLDQFIWGTVSRISPEAPVPVVRVGRESYHLGGAGNVVNNLAALGGRAAPVGIIGNDPAGKHAIGAMEAISVAREGVIEIAGRATTLKTRIVAHAQQVVRFDREDDDPLAPDADERLRDAALAALEGAAALVVSDYEKGVVSETLLKEVLPRAAAMKIPVVVDPKPSRYRAYWPITAITPNTKEAAEMTGVRIRDEADARRAGAEILKDLGCAAVLITMGEKGMLLCEKGAEAAVIPTAARQVYDVTGAGDTVVAAFVLSLSAGATMLEAASIANAAAGVVVGKVGTATVTPEELNRALEG